MPHPRRACAVSVTMARIRTPRSPYRSEN